MSARAPREARSVAERLVPDAFVGADHSPIVSTFIRGLTTGALVGAAIAGSALVSRYRRSRQHPADTAGPPTSAGDRRV
ncbi:MAG TPA: hypothetical protein VGC90_02585 [Candidatus Limnocylindrales bacterium]